MNEIIKLFPGVPVILLIFQLLHIWFKDAIYFSWWWIVIILVIWTIIYTLADKLSNVMDKYGKTYGETLTKKLKDLDDRTSRTNSGNKILTDDVYELKKKNIDLERRLKKLENRGE